MNIRDKIKALEPQITAASETPDLKEIFRKIENDWELTTREMESLFYALDCKDLSLYSVLCVVYAALESGRQADIDSLSANLKDWAERENIQY